MQVVNIYLHNCTLTKLQTTSKAYTVPPPFQAREASVYNFNVIMSDNINILWSSCRISWSHAMLSLTDFTRRYSQFLRAGQRGNGHITDYQGHFKRQETFFSKDSRTCVLANYMIWSAYHKSVHEVEHTSITVLVRRFIIYCVSRD
jgi:hypothetical protein